MREILPLVLIAVLLFPHLNFSLEVSRLIILTDKLSPELFKAIEIDEYYLSQKGIVCEAYTNEQIENCLRTYKAKEVWYVYLGHSNGENIGDFLSIDTINFPQKVDYIILDACNLGNNPKINRLLKFVKRGIFAVKGKDPYLGMLPLYKVNWKTPTQALKLLREFYKNDKRSENFIFLSP